MNLGTILTTAIFIAGFFIIFSLSRKYVRKYYHRKDECEKENHVHMEAMPYPINTGFSYNDSDSERRDVWVSPLGKFYVIRTSAAGKQYNKYIHDHYEEAYKAMFTHDHPEYSHIFEIKPNDTKQELQS